MSCQSIPEHIMIRLLIHINVMKLKYPLKYYCNHESAIDVIYVRIHTVQWYIKITFTKSTFLCWKWNEVEKQHNVDIFRLSNSPCLLLDVGLWMALFLSQEICDCMISLVDIPSFPLFIMLFFQLSFAAFSIFPFLLLCLFAVFLVNG